MAKARSYGGVYENMDFPPYSFQEYPKHIRTGNGMRFEIAHNAEEEAKILDRVGRRNEIIEQEKANVGEDPQRERLIMRARELEVPINTKWSNYKLQSVVREAEESLDALPAEPYQVENKLTSHAEQDAAVAVGITSEEELKDKLVEEAKSLGYPATKLWGTTRLRNAIAEAKLRNNIQSQ